MAGIELGEESHAGLARVVDELMSSLFAMSFPGRVDLGLT